MEKPSSQSATRTALLTTLGRIGAPYGIKGWVKLISYTDPAANILNFRHFILTEANLPGGRSIAEQPQEIEIDESRAQGKDLLGHIKGCDDREQARQYTGRELQVDRELLPDLAAEEFYWFQLEGLQVVNLQDEILGSVHHLLETGANDVLVVRPDANSLDDQERLIPWIRDQVIKKVDLALKQIRVDWERDF